MKNIRVFVIMSAALSGMICLTSVSTYADQLSFAEERPVVRDMKTKRHWDRVKNGSWDVVKIGIATAIPVLSSVAAKIFIVDGEYLDTFLKARYGRKIHDFEYSIGAGLIFGQLINEGLQAKFPALRMSGKNKAVAGLTTLTFLWETLRLVVQ